MFHQLLTPIGGSLPLSFLVAALPVATVLVLLGVVRRPAWQASLAGVVVALVIAVGLWRMPAGLALDSTAAGMVFACWPVMWIVFNSLILYNLTVATGRFDALRRWMIEHMPGDKRVVLIVIGFCFGSLLEGVAGFGTPIAICSSLLIALGFPTLEALTYTLIFDTAPVAFGALGVPVTTLAGVTGLPAHDLGSMIGRQLPFMAFLLPFYVTTIYGGLKSIRALFPVLLVAAGSFALTQFAVSNYLDFTLTDVLSSLISLLVTVGFLKLWRPAPDPAYAVARPEDLASESDVPTWQAWLPWIGLSLVVILWTTFKAAAFGDTKIPWPGLDKQVFITLYNKPYAAVWDYQPLATGTAILVSAILTAAALRVGPKGFLAAAWTSWKQIRLAVLTVALIVGLAYLMNYSGLTYTLGLAVSKAGPVFPILSAFLGWVAVFLSGSDTSGNALFGNLQVVAAKQLNLSPVLIAATNSSGGVMGKMISPQNIATGVAVTDLKGKEGVVLARTFKHSIILTVILGLLVLAQQHLMPWMIP
jgi:lactate permease